MVSRQAKNNRYALQPLATQMLKLHQSFKLISPWAGLFRELIPLGWEFLGMGGTWQMALFISIPVFNPISYHSALLKAIGSATSPSSVSVSLKLLSSLLMTLPSHYHSWTQTVRESRVISGNKQMLMSTLGGPRGCHRHRPKPKVCFQNSLNSHIWKPFTKLLYEGKISGTA